MNVLNYRQYNSIRIFEKLNENVDQDDPKNLLRKESKADVKRCVTKCVTLYPFFGEFLIACRFLFDHPGVDTMATDGKNIFISSAFVATLSDDETVFILCHEVLHMLLCHHIRMFNKIGKARAGEAKKWNYAADYELNPMLVRDGLLTKEQLINDIKGLYKDEYVGKPAEYIYDHLGDEDENDQSQNSDYTVNVGDVIYTKNKTYGKIAKINANGTYEVEDITEDEAKNILKK